MNRITNITKRDVYEVFYNGFELDNFFETNIIKYCYYGRLGEIEFLKRIYDLSILPSYDSRYANAEEDIFQHTVNNDDYEFCWVFNDDRFSLSNGNDEIYLRFLCEIFNPEVRYERGYWKEILEIINNLLKNDGYELFVSKKISGRDVYGWRIYNSNDRTLFLPFSQRNLEDNKMKKISVSKRCREQLYKLINSNDEVFYETSETGWNYTTTSIQLLFENINQFYTPKAFDENKNYMETSDIKLFICENHPSCVFDALELFCNITNHADFESKVNIFLKNNSVPLKLENGKMVNSCEILKKDTTISFVQEAGLKELMQEAFRYKENGELSIAVEKIWDALERLKTHYTNMDKKTSIKKIVKNMSSGESEFEKIFNEEFNTLTKLGNTLRIRHHEMDRVDIENVNHLDYLFNRCYIILDLALQFLQ